MENFDQIELDKKRAFRNKILIIGGIAFLVVAVIIFLILTKGSKDIFNSDIPNPNTLISPTASETLGESNPIFSKDIATWGNYNWSGKVNTHYPSDWQFEEEINGDGSVVGLKITPPTSNAEDIIFIGGISVKCSDVLKYLNNKCLKNRIQIPFYTNSQNPEVLSAFDLIFQNSILTDEEK